MKDKYIFIPLVVIAVLVLGSLYWGGYRTNGLSAARAHSFVPKDAILLDQVNYNWGNVYIFNSKEKYVTAISNKKYGVFWVSRYSTFLYHHGDRDPVKTVGGVTVADGDERATVFSAVVTNPEVAWLEVGPEGNKQRKNAVLGEPVTFSWETSLNWLDLKPKALNQEGQVLYEYRFARANYTDMNELRWYPVE